MKTHLSPLDEDVMDVVRTLGQVSSSQMQRLLFSQPGLSEKTRGVRCRRVLRRLWSDGYIDRLPRVQGRAEGGSSGYTYIPARSRAHRLDPHQLDIAEIYVLLIEAQRQGLCRVLEFTPEEVVRGSTTKTDAYLWLETYPEQGVKDSLTPVDNHIRDVTNMADAVRTDWYLEIDRGSEFKTQLNSKANSYSKAAKRHEVFPRTMYVVTFAPRGRYTERVALIQSVLRRQEFPEQFELCTINDVVQRITGG